MVLRMDFMTVDDLQELLYYSIFFTDAEYSAVLSLFHYTSRANMCHIIKESHIDLRLTRADCFADVNEGQHIIKVFRNAVNACVACQKIDQTFAKALLSVISDFFELRKELRDYYVFCFSKNDCNTYLEKHYACRDNKDGVVIGFQALAVESLGELEFQNHCPIELIDVLYDEQKLSSYLQGLFSRVYQLRVQDDEQFSLCKKIAVNQLAIYSLAYKSSKFQNEEETRLIVDFGHVDLQSCQIVPDSNDKYIHVLLKPTSIYCVREVTTT